MNLGLSASHRLLVFNANQYTVLIFSVVQSRVSDTWQSENELLGLQSNRMAI